MNNRCITVRDKARLEKNGKDFVKNVRCISKLLRNCEKMSTLDSYYYFTFENYE